ncbi:deoxyribonuclease IV [Granulicatella adiacens ATCC 49175]|uniref:Probable endonuclease 4 n=1 Tax=Granulicatella adiacens ATCC 49175 TaxID=638301 RepID=C8NF08_9LACT|nr:deoxyribonuclease IV [Granulicatella adiacens]EEW37717.1 apurinic endonuclease (APN1) [Granulicatella adiacens ATCC 49175]UAK93627.1 deoxyribonuclease IV [Granulicatella adiacens]UWP37376.1 deoxyribonuclease IV [Granulicatella adiacens ATCC 49175]
MLIGSHVSMSGKDMLLGSAKEAYSYGANVMMVYTGAPQNTRRKPIEELNAEIGKKFMAENGIKEVVVHAPYIINLANTTKEGYIDFAIDFLKEELRRAEAVGATQVVLHPGSHVGAGVDVGLNQIIYGLNQVITKDQTVQIALETMAGKGTELARTFEELARIIDGVTCNEHLSVTFDTCHVHDAGYDIKNDLSGVLTQFDKTVGLDRIKVLHINDSKNPVGAHKDRHENFGFGEIGFDALMNVIQVPEFKNLPKILETPWIKVEDKVQIAPYKKEIEMIRSGKFDSHWIEELLNQERRK